MFAHTITVATIVLLAVSAAGAQAAEPVFEDCHLKGSLDIRRLEAECARFTVPENPDDPDGKTIELFVARVASLARDPEPDPLVFITGGPGQAATESFVDMAAAFQHVLRKRPILLVDQRGTGRSNALECPVLETEDIEELNVVTATESCLDSLSGDPRYYTTSVAVRDLDALRDAIGIDQLNLYGISYGTRVVLHYLRRYPERVRTAIIDGVAPSHLALGPGIAVDAQSALDRLIERCEADTACATAFPRLPEGFDEIVTTLSTSPVEVTLPDPVTAEIKNVEFGLPAFSTAVRLLSYSPDTVALLPLLLHRAYVQGDYGPIAAQALMVNDRMVRSLSYGMHNAIVCTEDAPFYEISNIERERIADTYLGTQMIDLLEAMCAHWPAGLIDDDFKTPVVSDRPVLILSGGADPVTPAANGVQAAKTLSNNMHIVVTDHGHGVAPLGCTPRLMAEFLDTGDPSAVDSSCLEIQAPTPFFLTFSGPTP